MFVGGYPKAEIWAILTDCANGIWQRGRHGDAYPALTVGKALARSA